MSKPAKRTLRERWVEIFEELKDSFSGEIKEEGKLPHLIGKCNGKDFIIKPFKNDIEFAINVESDFNLGLSLEPSGLWKKIAVKQDINIGVKDFDSRFVITGDPIDKVIEFLSYETVRDTIRCFEPIKSFNKDKSSVAIRKSLRASEITPGTIDFLLVRLGELVDCIEKPETIEEEKLPEEVFKKKVEEIGKGLDSDKATFRFEFLEKRIAELEKRIDALEEK